MASIVSRGYETGERLRLFAASGEDKKGLILSHLIGFALFSEFALNIFKFNLPFTPANSIPIRLILVWLLIDRTNRIGRVRADFWDYCNIGFLVLVAFGIVFNAAFNPQIPVSFDDYRRFVGIFINAYIYFLVIKEGINRRGFRPDIMVKWMVVGLVWSAVLGLMQALDLFGARMWSLVYSGANLAWLRKVEDSSLASGTAPWWNSMALEMVIAFALVFGPAFLRKPRIWEWCTGILFTAAFVATQSRGGLVAFGGCAIATFIWYVYHKKYKIAFVIGTVFSIAVIAWLFAVFALKIERFTRTIEGEKVRGSVYSQSIDNRVITQMQAFNIGAKSPLFGTGPSFSLFSGPSGTVDIYSPFAIRGPVDGQYGLVFAQFGLVGILFLLLIQGYLISFIRYRFAYRPYAFAAFFTGVAFSLHGIVEFLFYGRVMVILSVLAALAGSRYLASENGRRIAVRMVGPLEKQAGT